MREPATMLEAALEYRQHGLSIFPTARDKRPMIEWAQYQKEPPHCDQVDVWWDEWPEANIGCATGVVSDLVVLDADGRQGLASLKALNTPATTWLSKTGRLEGGWQQFFKHPGVEIRNRAGVRPGLDVRGDGGYVILPPSLHASGQRYIWLTAPADLPLAPLPGHVLELLVEAPSPAAEACLGGEIPEGQRNDQLHRLARSLALKGLSEPAVLAALLEENRVRCRPSLGEREVRELVAHAMREPHRRDFAPAAMIGANGDGPMVSRPAIEVVDAADLVVREFPEEHPLVGGGLIVPHSLNVNGGPPKRGKSLLVLNREIRRALGQPFLGFPTRPGRTLYIQAEIPEPQLKQRLALMLGAAGADGGPIDAEQIRRRILTVTRRGLFLDESDGYDGVRRLVDETEPDLLSLDPLARFMTGEENSARDMGRLINGLDRLIQAYKIAIELVHHTGKPAAGDPRQGGQRLRGSSALFGAADSVVLLDRTQDAWTLTFELRHAEEPPPMTLTRTSTLWFQPAGPPEKLVAVAALVKDLPLRFTALVGAIKGDMKVSEATAERLVRDAKKASLVWQDDDGRYRTNHHAPSEPR